MLAQPQVTPERHVRDYKAIFKSVESTLYEVGSRNVTVEQIRADLDSYKRFEGVRLTDEQYYRKLVHIIFYSGFRAETVSQRIGVIDRNFPSYATVTNYNEGDIQRIISDPQMIRNERKIRACVANAKQFKRTVAENGSFYDFVKALPPPTSDAEILALRDRFQRLFKFLGGITAFHFMTDIGIPVLKPDRVIQRIFKRLGLVSGNLKNDALYLACIREGKKFAESTGYPIRYIDIVFVAYGQVQSSEIGIMQGICLEENPNCSMCGAMAFCDYYVSKWKSAAAP